MDSLMLLTNVHTCGTHTQTRYRTFLPSMLLSVTLAFIFLYKLENYPVHNDHNIPTYTQTHANKLIKLIPEVTSLQY